MNIKTFTQEVRFNNLVPDEDAIKEGRFNEWKKERATKTATFKELDENDRDQHILHFDLVNYYSKDEKEAAKFDARGTYDLTVGFINTNLIITDQFTGKDKELLLLDSRGLLVLGMWLVKNKFTPFFLEYARELIS